MRSDVIIDAANDFDAQAAIHRWALTEDASEVSELTDRQLEWLKRVIRHQDFHELINEELRRRHHG